MIAMRHTQAAIDSTLGSQGVAPSGPGLVDYVRSRGGSITVRQLQLGPRRYRTSEEVARLALDALVDAGWGYWSPIRARGGLGRHMTIFRLKGVV